MKGQLLIFACCIVQVSCFLPINWHAQTDPHSDADTDKRSASDQDGGFTLKRLDHYVITVKDINRTVQFYTGVLGMKAKPLGARIALHFGESKINVHQRGREVGPTASVVRTGTSDVCLVTDADINTVIKHLEKMKVPIIMGPSRVSGAIGTINSVYFRDPDGNLIEIGTYNF